MQQNKRPFHDLDYVDDEAFEIMLANNLLYETQAKNDSAIDLSVSDHHDDESEHSSNWDEYESDIDEIFCEKEKKKKFNELLLDFKVWSKEELLEHQNTEINYISEILGIKCAESRKLLVLFEWCRELLLEKVMDNRKKYINDSNNKKQVPGTCEICLDDVPNSIRVSNCSSHCFCDMCFAQYISMKVADNECELTCPGEKCNVSIPQDVIESNIENETLNRYRELLLTKFVGKNSMKFCPFPNCDYIIQVKSLSSITPTKLARLVPTVQCRCLHRFCFCCKEEEDHLPIPCEFAKNWRKKMLEDNQTANWMMKNTKDCPKCQTSIEKNGGCSHITCTKCKHEFCWLCYEKWFDHNQVGHACNRFEENAVSKKASARSIEKYLHYFTRFDNHHKSLETETTVLLPRVNLSIIDYQEKLNFSSIDTEFLENSMNSLLKARKILKWTYGFVYYLPSGNQKYLFEDIQQDLEVAVENLSDVLEKGVVLTEEDAIKSFKTKLLDRSVYVDRRRAVLVEEALVGLKNGTWKFKKQQ